MQRAFIILVYRQAHIPYRPHVYIAISELVHLRSAGISSPYFSQPQPELLICHRPSSFRRRPTEERMDMPRLIVAAFYRRRGNASLRLSTLSRVKFKSLHARLSLIYENSKVFFVDLSWNFHYSRYIKFNKSLFYNFSSRSLFEIFTLCLRND